MGYEKEVLARARVRHQEAVDQFQRIQQERRERIYREYPRVQELDQQLRRTMAEFTDRIPGRRWSCFAGRISICSRNAGRSCGRAATERSI